MVSLSGRVPKGMRAERQHSIKVCQPHVHMLVLRGRATLIVHVATVVFFFTSPGPLEKLEMLIFGQFKKEYSTELCALSQFSRHLRLLS